METRWKEVLPSPPRSPVIIRIAVCGRAIGELLRGHTLDINLYALLDILCTVSRRYLGERGNSIFRGAEFPKLPSVLLVHGRNFGDRREELWEVACWESAVDSLVVTLQLPGHEIFSVFFFFLFVKLSYF